jgi:hypothetical protein
VLEAASDGREHGRAKMKNAIRETEPGVFAVTLTQGKVALVDRVDLETIAPHRWYARNQHRAWYAQTNVPLPSGKRTTMQMHLLLLRDAESVDHINGDGLDNRRANLRAASRTDNNHNARKRLDNTSGFKGVSWCKRDRSWLAQIGINGRRTCIGRYATPELGARAYDAAARAHFGAYAALNFPEPGERASG